MTSADLLFAVARGEVSKSQLRDGRYVPASKLTPLGRAKQRDAVKNGSYKAFSGTHKDMPKGRGLGDVYRSHAVSEGIATALKEQTRASKVHAGVHYGESVSPELERQIDHHLKPEIVRSAKAPIAFHHGRAGAGVVAGATGSHVTTGGKARVILNHQLVAPHGRLAWGLPFDFGEVLNHEASHATVAGKNPRRFFGHDDSLNQVKTLGEEARADGRGVHGHGLYQRNGVVQGEAALRAAERDTAGIAAMNRTQRKQFDEALAAHRHYPKVREKVRAAYSPSPERGHLPPPEQPRYTPPPHTPPPRSHIPSGPARNLLNSRLTRVMAAPKNRAVLLSAAAGGVGGYLGFRHKRAQMARAEAARTTTAGERTYRRASDGKFSKALDQVSPPVEALFAQARGEVSE